MMAVSSSATRSMARIANALKFHGTAVPRIDISARCEGGKCEFLVTDNVLRTEASSFASSIHPARDVA
jgi:hypothetical protein